MELSKILLIVLVVVGIIHLLKNTDSVLPRFQIYLLKIKLKLKIM